MGALRLMTHVFETVPSVRRLRFFVLAIAAAIGSSTLCLVPVPASASAAAGLVAAYGFEEGSGSTVVDSSGNGNTGSLVGAARVAGGVFGDALSFDGRSARVIVADSPSLRLRRAMT